MFRRIVFYILAVTLPAATWPMATPQQATTDQLTYEEGIERIDRLMGLIEGLRSHIDRSQFDLQALLGKLDYDADQIIGFTKNKIAFEQYPGLLRGPEGTLVSRAGNALDQSVLLAKLLRDAGYDARIARGKLNDAQARTLLQQMTAHRGPTDAIGDIEAMAELIKTSTGNLGIDARPLLEALEVKAHVGPNVDDTAYVKATRENQDYLLSTLADAKITLGDPDGIRQILDEAKDYFWVQYRPGPSQQWTNEHPVFRNSDSFEQIEASEVFGDTIPAALQHRFRFEIVLEQNLGGKTVSKNIVPPWERPVANLAGKELTYQTLSRHLLNQLQNDESVSAPPDGIDILLPILNGDVIGDAFDLLGNAIDSDAAASPFAPLFATLSGQTAKAANALSALGSSAGTSDSGQAYLKALKLKLSFLEPDGTEVVHWRSLYESTPDILENRDLWNARFQDLTQVVYLGFMVGASNDAHTLDLTFQTLGQNLKSFQHLLPILEGKKFSELDSTKMAGSQNLRWVGNDLMPAVFDALPINDPGLLIYRSAPTLLLFSQTVSIAGAARNAIDIVQNPRRAVDVEELTLDPQAVLLSGVWDTVTEGALINRAGTTPINTRNLFEEARNNDVPINVISKATINSLDALEIPGTAKARILEEVDRGFVVISPTAGSIESSEVHGWWRIDPRTGSALGMVTDGYRYGGSELAENALIIIVGGAFVLGAIKTLICAQDESKTFGDCVCEATLAVLATGGGIVAFVPGKRADGIGLGIAIVALLIEAVCIFAPLHARSTRSQGGDLACVARKLAIAS